MSGAGKGGIGDVYAPFRRLLDEAALTDAEVGEGIGVSHGTVCRWRNGRSDPDVEMVDRAVSLVEDHIEELSRFARLTRKLLAAWRALVGPHTGRIRTGEPRDRSTPPAENYVPVRLDYTGTRLDIAAGEHSFSSTVRRVPGAVVYLLLRSGDVVYVGHSESLYWRLGHHQRIKDFDEWASVEMETKQGAIDLERALISELDPEYNAQKTPAAR